MTDSEILDADTSLYYSEITGSTVVDERVRIAAITNSTVTLEPTVNDSNLKSGDAITIGSYGGDHRRITTRIVKSYDSETKTVTLNRMIDDSDFMHINSLRELVGEFVLLKNAPLWLSNVEQICDIVQSANPVCKIYLATCGIPNYYHRRLFGYRELAKQLILKNKYTDFVDFYQATFDYQYKQTADRSLTITATSAKRYRLNISGRVAAVLSVTVDGQQRTDYKIVGGYSWHWDTTSNVNLSNSSLKVRDFYIEFENAVVGDIVVNYTYDAWSNDYTHPQKINGLTDGVGIFGRTVADTIANQIK